MKIQKTASTKTSKQDQEPEGDVETIHVNPNQDFPAHRATYPNPVAEKQKVEEYIKLIRHDQIRGTCVHSLP